MKKLLLTLVLLAGCNSNGCTGINRTTSCYTLDMCNLEYGGPMVYCLQGRDTSGKITEDLFKFTSKEVLFEFIQHRNPEPCETKAP